MKPFFESLWNDIRAFPMLEMLFSGCLILAVYGSLVTHPVMVYDFAAAKGDPIQVFLTYFFMHRWTQGLFAGLFHDFIPLWNATIGLAFFFISTLFLGCLLKRASMNRFGRILGMGLWIVAPFFYNRSVFQHAIPAEFIAFCFDMLVLLYLQQALLEKKNVAIWSIFFVAISIGVYQSHANLLLTGACGVLLLHTKNNRWQDFWRYLITTSLVLGGGVLLWIVIDYGPLFLAKLVGITIPPSGGAHDTIYWFDGTHSFIDNLKGLGVGILCNWVYPAFSIVGLRILILCELLLASVALWKGCVKRNLIECVSISLLALSIFAFAVLQCATANIRTFYCFTPLILFTFVYLWQGVQSCKTRTYLFGCISVLILLTMGHETASLYYYRWKIKEHDKLHFSVIATDLYRLYGTTIQRPVAIIGGFKDLPTGWNDLRPWRNLPLLSSPFSLYSNVSSINCPREFYMVAREHVGLIAHLPKNLNEYYAARDNHTLIENTPCYPQPGYIFEQDEMIIVNLGKNQWQQPFRYADYRSPNEELLFKTFQISQIADGVYNMTEPIRQLGERYPWAISR